MVVLLWSPRSEASAQLGDVLAQLADADGGKWSLATVNVDAVPRVAQMFGVQAVPTVVALAAGQPLSSFQGVQPPEQLRRWVDSLLNATAGKLGGAADGEEPEQVDPELAQARAHLDAGDFDAALTAYQALLDANPNDAEAKGAVRQIGFLQRATTQRARRGRRRRRGARRHRRRFRRGRCRDPAAERRGGIRPADRADQADRRRRAHQGPHPADRVVRSVRPGRSRGDRGPAQPRQRAVLVAEIDEMARSTRTFAPVCPFGRS